MEDDYIQQARVSPHWITEANTFWYRQNLPFGRFAFIHVDAVEKRRRSAFDHHKLARALEEKTNLKDGVIDAFKLPFTWIDLETESLSVRFMYEGKKWQFDNTEENLSEWEGTLNLPKTPFLSKEHPSVHSNHSVRITFVNNSKADLKIYWIDWQGNPVLYGGVGSGLSSTQRTYAGHVWKFVDESEIVRAIYDTPEEVASSVVIDENTMEELSPLGSEDKDKEGNGNRKPPDSCEKNSSRLFVRAFDLWHQNDDQDEVRLSDNGADDNRYDDSNIWISPDKKFCIAWQFVPEEEHKVHLRDSVPNDQLEPKVKSIRYLKAGDRVRIDRPRLFNLGSKKEIATDVTLFQTPYELRNIGWSYDSSEYRFIYNERGHQRLRVIGVNTDGVVRSLVEESSDTFIDYSTKLNRRVIKDTDEFIWASERDGFNHLYLFDLQAGKLKNQMTTGKWNVKEFVHFDEEARVVWFSACGVFPGQDPYHTHLARINFDGTGFKVLTDGDGTHNWTISLGHKYFFDTWSRVDSPPRTALRSMENGALVVHLEGSEEDSHRLKSEGWVAPERFNCPGRDGEESIYGIIVRPPDFDPKKKYPILESVYAGPHGFHVPKEFSPLRSRRQWAELGYVVVQIDGMGTNWRSKKFQDVSWKNLKDAGFPDRIAWMKAAAETRPWMDINRVGIFGGSAGGQNAVGALLFHGDFYRAAVADCGCHDNRMDKIWWSEQWMGYPVDKAYEDSSNVVHASKLTGALMLIVAEMDDNVDPASTLQLVNALNDADKDFEFLYMPGAYHCSGRTKYALRRQERFFRQHLQGLE
ncbi:Alpha/Beta hydrolase protein [Colletotrichum godetiae]|uniref:Probable dipeptidyl-aminopeptidase B n=1 Tax=Colletotrichum godetiae TaxID=1209918 RepID=A0AAJ0EWI4_9PEZI|nr:Alpha/Beta hydrolase protein [Colletotrichum godetiae]KAK1674244.1 Alpha/Beta hydrolase protein [Colletotrichum godetiae]